MKTRAPLFFALALSALGMAYAVWGYFAAPRQQSMALLDPARIVLIRTPGGMLEVGAMEKVEEFGWSSRYTCPLVDCPALLKPTISRIRVRAHYVYRVPLAAEWQLQRDGDHYKLTVPQPQLQDPVAFHTQDMQIQTQREGWLSPSAGGNREAVVRHLGPELARRGQEPAYLAAQRAQAEKTVAEFAGKWLLEQGQKAALPIQVAFDGSGTL